MTRIKTIFCREFKSYFSTPLASVFLVIFLFLAGMFTFNVGGLYERGQADLRPFFQFHPWLYLFLVPAVSMRLWAEERRLGTIELLVTLPFTLRDLVVGKFLAGWAFIGVALVLTFPLWVTVAYLGDPDHGVVLSSYIGSFLMAGSFLAIGSCLSSLTKNQVIAFVMCVVASFLFLLSGFSVVLDFFRGWAPPVVVDSISSISFLTHFESMMRGVIDLRDLVFYFAVMVSFLMMNVFLIDWKKAV